MKNVILKFRPISSPFSTLLCLLNFYLFFPVCLFSNISPPIANSILQLDTEYIPRYSIVGEHGDITFIGNTLLTNYASSAELIIPTGSTILYAELIWSGSYNYSTDALDVDPNCIQFVDGPIGFITADKQLHLVKADSATKLQSQHSAIDVPPFLKTENYTRSANVTTLFSFPSLTNPNGTYIVKDLPSNASHTPIGWTLAIIYRNPANANIKSMALFVSAQQGSGTMEAQAQIRELYSKDFSSTIDPSARLHISTIAENPSRTDDYMINAIGVEIDVNAPIIVPIQQVNAANNIISEVGDMVTFSFTINNTGSEEAENILFQDILEPCLTLVPNTFKVNDTIISDPNLAAGVSLGTMSINEIVTVEFQAVIINKPASGHISRNIATTSFDCISCNPTELFQGSNRSNVTTIRIFKIVASLTPPPNNFNGTTKKCRFLDKTRYVLSSNWNPSPSPDVLFYKIFENDVPVATIPAVGPYIYERGLRSKKDAKRFTIVAVYANNAESSPVTIRIIK